MDRLQGKVAFITGSGSGIGRAASVLFAKESAKVAVADISPAGGEETVRLVREAGGEAVYVETDVTDPLSVERAIKSVADRWGKLDILYNNAGGSTAQDGRVTEVSIEEWWRAIRLDLFGTFLCCKFGIPQLIRAGGGAVINTTSVVALCGVVGRNAYTAAKGGVLALTRSMAVEYGKHHVQVNVLAPGATLTERVRKFLTNDPRTQATDDKHLLGLGEPEDVARTALFLASDDARRITGAVFPVDSGWSAA
ncbi:MAG TPA: SDR family oxidoreductase [Candidatus Binataceae bacterium]|nr:SDR family oxidoreductase [Candidatus Binataceae bacterium]